MFLGYIHYFRALAIIFIVAGHSIDALVWSNIDVERLIRIFLSNGSVLFVFIAGYLFQHLSNKLRGMRYFSSKVKNVILPYLLISIPAIILSVTVFKQERVWPEFYDQSIWEQVVFFYLSGAHLAPLWFIPMICIFYLISPLLLELDKGRLIYVMIPGFIVISCIVGRGLPHYSFVHFLSVYLLGMYFSKYKEEINPIISRAPVVGLAFVLVIGLGMIEFFYTTATMSYWNYLQKLSMAVFFLGLFIRYNSHLTSKFVSRLADNSFGIFFIHSYALTSGKMLFERAHGSLADGNGLLLVGVIGLTLMLCFYLIELIRSMFGPYSRMLVGS